MDKTQDIDKLKSTNDEKNVDEQDKIDIKPTQKISSLKRIPPKRGTIENSIKPSLSRFQLDTPIKSVVSAPAEPQHVLPSSIFKSTAKTTQIISTPKPEIVSSSHIVHKQTPTIVAQSTKSMKSFLDVEKPTIKKGDRCTQYNSFIIKENSCYIDSLLFSLLHKFENNFINDLQHIIISSGLSRESCKYRTVDRIIRFYHEIHDKTQPIKKLDSKEFRELLFECDRQRLFSEIPKSVYTETQQDPHDFLSKILHIIGLPECEYSDIKTYSRPSGNSQLISNFRDYNPKEIIINTYNSLLIYPASEESLVIDIGFRQIDDNTFAFITPEEDTEFERATWEYNDIVEFIHKHNLIDNDFKDKLREEDKRLLEFFKQDLEHTKLIELYKEIYNTHIMVYSAKLKHEVEHYIYRDDLPKLTYSRSVYSKVFKNPINYFFISIAREKNDLKTKNNLHLINLPEKIQSYGKTLELVSAVVHYGINFHRGHYVCYFKCGSHWYAMDNSLHDITQYAPFDITNREIMSQCRLLIYM